jgi:peptidoglycan/xylan/chitin deacetylase (PgdA/CDA1 family)
MPPRAAKTATKVKPFQEIRQDLASRTPILTYHDFLEKRGKGALWFDCTEKEFAEQIVWLKTKGATFISLDQLHEALTQGTGLPPKAVALTFADNYLGFYRFALPILRQYKIPGTMFVHTGYVGSSIGRPKMDWSHLRELEQEGLVKVGSQTVSHPSDLRNLSPEELRSEFTESRKSLEDHLKVDIPYLAYPNGKWNATTCAAAKDAGYLMALTEVTAPAEKSGSILSVNRYVHTKFRQAWRDAYGR